MFTQADLDELLTFRAEEDQVISLYANTDPAQQPIETIKLQIRGLLKDVESAEDVGKIEQHFELTHDWRKAGTVIFSCAAQDFFRAYQTAVPFRNRLRIEDRPYLKPLLHLLRYYAHYGVILVDRIGARFFAFHLGELKTAEGTVGEDVRKLKHGHGSSAAGRRGGSGGARAEDEQAQRNMREAAEAALHFFERHKIERLFIGGTAENVAQFREMLPRELQNALAGTFPMNIEASKEEVRERSLAQLHELNAQREQKLVDRMLAGAAGDGPAVTGLERTLRMLSEGRVDTLLVSDGYRAAGFRHAASGYLSTTTEIEHFKKDEFELVADVVNAAVNRTLEQGGHVEVIANHPALEQAGRIGALLRY
ncbi:MAG: hypothetical protein R3272_00050 [Candidatus Promineifilaceae bacterium]|nr:hypothetical protein [Candidatus Promineifilaceae bacterium]